MRLLVVAEQLRRAVPGGIGTYTRGLVQGLSALDETVRPEVTLWASRPPGGGRSRPDPLAALGPVVTTALPARAQVAAWDRGIGRIPAGAAADVVHATSFALPPTGDVPLTVMVHDLAWRHFPEAYPARGRRWHDAALGRAIERASMLVVPSTPVADDLLVAGASSARVVVIEEGCDHLLPADDAAADALLSGLGLGSGEFLLTVSTLEPRKNLARLIAAYALARPRLPEPWPLVVAGPAGWGPDLLVPGPGVILAGYPTGGALTALYRRARVVAYVPLLEGFGLPVAEAMSCGTPVVASPVPSAGGAALEVDPFDVEGIADALVTAATDDARRAELVASGLERTALLTWSRAARGHVDLWAAAAQ